jgi:hypothetical protein
VRGVAGGLEVGIANGRIRAALTHSICQFRAVDSAQNVRNNSESANGEKSEGFENKVCVCNVLNYKFVQKLCTNPRTSPSVFVGGRDGTCNFLESCNRLDQ